MHCIIGWTFSQDCSLTRLILVLLVFIPSAVSSRNLVSSTCLEKKNGEDGGERLEFYELALVWKGNEQKWTPEGFPGRSGALLADTSLERQA